MLRRWLIKLLLLPFLFTALYVLFFWSAFELPRLYRAYFGIGSHAEFDHGSSVVGVDANANGVRDDIDAYIQRTFTEPGQQAAALQLARALQSTLTADIHDRAAVDASSTLINYAVACVWSRFKSDAKSDEGADTSSRIIQDFQDITINTSARRKAYAAYNGALSGTVQRLSSGDTCE